MNSIQTFSLKYYPPALLILIVILIACLYLAVKKSISIFIFHTDVTWYYDIIILLGSVTLIRLLLTIVNKYLVFKWVFTLLGLDDFRGRYEGVLTSSFKMFDDKNMPNIKKNMLIDVYQNLNGVYIEGYFMDIDSEEKSSTFCSSWVDIKALDNNQFQLIYEYGNKGNLLHNEHNKYILDTHEGIAKLIFNPLAHTIEGYYYNYERGSNGKIFLNKK